MKNNLERRRQQGFTLIEMSIVLVIIGLIVGGVLVGQDLIKSAQVRAQITQVERYNTAANTFRGVYGYLPGDVPGALATSLGLVARGGEPGRGDGNGLIQGYEWNYNSVLPASQTGETWFFWEDLSSANLVEGTFKTAIDHYQALYSNSQFAAYSPAARIGGNNYVYVYSGGISGTDGNNYFGLSIPSAVNIDTQYMTSSPGLTVNQAYAIDTKVDDGLPQSGHVTALYVNGFINGSVQTYVFWAGGGGGTSTAGPVGTAPGNAATGSSTTCYDNGGNASATMVYSTEQNGGNGVNCALSFQFQ